MSKILNVHIPAEQKNFAINRALDFWQEKGGSVTTVNTSANSSPYIADMVVAVSTGSTTKNYSIQRSTTVPTVLQSGFQSTYSYLFTMITGINSFAASDRIIPYQVRLEGLDYARIHGKAITYGFWAIASVPGAYSFNVQNSAETRSYVTTFNVNAANTYEFKSITIQMDVGGTWVFDNTGSLLVNIGSVTGSTYTAGSQNQWLNGSFHGAAGATNWTATSGATLRIAQFSIVEGSLGFGSTGFQRAGKTIQQELAMCQRYYETGVVGAITDGSNANVLLLTTQFRVSKRVQPTMLFNSSYGGGGTANQLSHINGGGNLVMASSSPSTEGLASGSSSSGSVAGRLYSGQYAADARL